MKTINYQLSSQKCLEEGWTLRAPSPLDLEDADCEVFVPEPLHPAMIASGKVGIRVVFGSDWPQMGKIQDFSHQIPFGAKSDITVWDT